MGCPARGKLKKSNIVIHSQKEALYKCTECQKTFAATKGTPFYRLHHRPELFVWAVTLLANGCYPQTIVAAFGLDERTVSAWWQAESGQHCQKVHQHLIERPRELRHIQMDEIRAKL
jgi:transposase-like protein